MADKLVVTKDGIIEQQFTPEEIAQRELDRQHAEEQALLDSLKPSPEEIKQAEFELNCLNLLMEVGLI